MRRLYFARLSAIFGLATETRTFPGRHSCAYVTAQKRHWLQSNYRGYVNGGTGKSPSRRNFLFGPTRVVHILYVGCCVCARFGLLPSFVPNAFDVFDVSVVWILFFCFWKSPARMRPFLDVTVLNCVFVDVSRFRRIRLGKISFCNGRMREMYFILNVLLFKVKINTYSSIFHHFQLVKTNI